MGSQEWSTTVAPFASAFWLRWRRRHRRRGHRHPFELLNWTAELCSYWNCLVVVCCTSSCCHLPLILPLYVYVCVCICV